jgi:hypothetical protein
MTLSKLLIEEYPLIMLPSLAIALNSTSKKGGNRNGDRKALFLQQVHYWTSKAEQSKGRMGRFQDGRWWIYNSISEWQRQFPFWADRTLERIISALLKDGVLLRFQEGAGAGTQSYFSIDYDRLDSLLEEWHHSDSISNPEYRQNVAVPQNNGDTALGLEGHRDSRRYKTKESSFRFFVVEGSPGTDSAGIPTLPGREGETFGGRKASLRKR